MTQIRSVLIWVLIFGATARSVNAIHCEKPLAICTFMYESGCPSTSKTTCNETGGTFLEGGDSACNTSCGLCVNYVGEQERCNLTLISNENGLKTMLCQPPLVCSKVSDGRCVHSDNCTWNSNNAYQPLQQSIHIWTLMSLIFTTCMWF